MFRLKDWLRKLDDITTCPCCQCVLVPTHRPVAPPLSKWHLYDCWHDTSDCRRGELSLFVLNSEATELLCIVRKTSQEQRKAWKTLKATQQFSFEWAGGSKRSVCSSYYTSVVRQDWMGLRVFHSVDSFDDLCRQCSADKSGKIKKGLFIQHPQQVMLYFTLIKDSKCPLWRSDHQGDHKEIVGHEH